MEVYEFENGKQLVNYDLKFFAEIIEHFMGMIKYLYDMDATPHTYDEIRDVIADTFGLEKSFSSNLADFIIYYYGFESCQTCAGLFKSSELDEDSECNECAVTYRCIHCTGDFKEEELTPFIDGENVCHGCYESEYHDCGNCGDTVHDSEYDCREEMCHSCIHEIEEEEST